ncbi:type II toxin-antitoxin system MqsR family toxin [Pseudomonas sp. PDM23]|uniref:type II toxin-antitoxin system MqsR family toxin n=1 Tax=unclassified Pseudomonas TaxID=196821 RepID=UPI001783B897|nr:MULTISPECIES: type II toxin-antitoxin system MqsR family toxin [unclassified Pseudomonas]MBD9502602.1 type II toxin-antitoxin system MqsR family toxin [Pseudomonas sp. PDM17]MBD9577474.1 type II toxin-antitoxin system MqsR family toxin [Pseudomonas sp. PDM23]MBD9670953.1 type II toxin-antitoxin system MqsR family toxin [Pseudomonas sp. PDM21]
MDKRTPHYKLPLIRLAVAERRYRFTRVALEGAVELGLESTEQVLAVITRLTAADFYKSMTTYADHSIWQDVYRPWVNGRQAYVKLTLRGDLLIVSFKEK